VDRGADTCAGRSGQLGLGSLVFRVWFRKNWGDGPRASGEHRLSSDLPRDHRRGWADDLALLRSLLL